MAKFRCVHTGNICEFTNEWDIKQMREHKEYTEIAGTPVNEEPTVKKTTIKSKEA
jgi:hypothetical protein